MRSQAAEYRVDPGRLLGLGRFGLLRRRLNETPNLDRLAQEGVRFTDAYAMTVCSPSRAILMTGKHAARLHITIWIEGCARAERIASCCRPDRCTTCRTPRRRWPDYFTRRLSSPLRSASGTWRRRPLSRDARLRREHRRHALGGPADIFWPYRGAAFGPEFRYVPHLEFGQAGEISPTG